MVTDSHEVHGQASDVDFGDIMKNTKLCFFWPLGKCKKMYDCPFAHNDSELRTKPKWEKTKLCYYSSSASGCKKGSLCSFAHSRYELADLAKNAPLAFCASSSASSANHVRLFCFIMMSSLNTDPIYRLGLEKHLNDVSKEQYHD
jgi:hypothetical protein